MSKPLTREDVLAINEIKAGLRRLRVAKGVSLVALAAAFVKSKTWAEDKLSGTTVERFTQEHLPTLAKVLGEEVYNIFARGWSSGLVETRAVPAPMRGASLADVARETAEARAADAAYDLAVAEGGADGRFDTAEVARIEEARRRAEKERAEQRAAVDGFTRHHMAF